MQILFKSEMMNGSFLAATALFCSRGRSPLAGKLGSVQNEDAGEIENWLVQTVDDIKVIGKVVWPIECLSVCLVCLSCFNQFYHSWDNEIQEEEIQKKYI